jgi:hypothetical protein
VLSLLIGVEEAEFTWLQQKTGSTDGNLGADVEAGRGRLHCDAEALRRA